MTQGRTVEVPAAIGVSYNLVLDKNERRTLVFQTHMPQDAGQGMINLLCDRMRIAADRQSAIYELKSNGISKLTPLSWMTSNVWRSW